MSIGRVPGATGIQPSIVTAKGDLIVATASGSVTNQAVGSNNQVLTADSAQADGVKWANGSAATLTTTGDLLYASAANTPARLGIGSTSQVLTVSGGVPTWATPSSGGMTLLSTTAISGTTVSVTGISGSYTELIIVIADFKAVNDNSQPTFRFNNDSGSNYVANGTIASSTDSSGNTAGTDKVWFAGQTGGGAGLDNAANDCILVMRIFRYAATDTFKAGTCYMIYPQNDGYFYSGITNFGYKSTSAISRIDVSCSGAGFASAGNIYVYGAN